MSTHTSQVISAKVNLSSLQIPVTVSEMAYGYQEIQHEDDDGMDVLAAVNFIDAHMLPFFSTKALIANNSWPIVLTDLNWFVDNDAGKKIYLSEVCSETGVDTVYYIFAYYYCKYYLINGMYYAVNMIKSVPVT
ncbi:hypothetical protein BDQ17DRAFT_1331050 [Cyathus striatus]|nr:hypothetical protein BDQ17DRAFT_1331050 [Cyathus striatus]